MNVKAKRTSDKKIEFEIEISSPKVDDYFQLAASELSKNMKIDGFRPGKIPIDIVEREKGSQELYDYAANLAVQKTLPEAILSTPVDEENNKIEITGQPEIVVTQVARGNSMIYKATFLTIPEVELGNYKGLKIKKEAFKVEEAEIVKSLEHIQKSRAKLVTVSRPAKKSDRVEIDFIIQSDGKTVKDGESKNQPLIIGEKHFMPGFEEKLEGMKAGEEKEITLVAPNNWPQKTLAGKKLNFQIKMNLIQEREVPKLSDEFAKSLGQFESLEDLKENIKKGIYQEKEIKEKEKARMKLIEEIMKESKMDIPETIIDIELDKMINELRMSTQNMGLEFDKYLSEIRKTIDDLKKEWHEQALKRVETSLILKSIARKEKIETTEKEIEEKMNEMLKRYPNTDEIKEKIDQEALRQYTKSVLENEKVFELLETEAKII